MTNEERLMAALEAMRPAFGNPSMLEQGRRMRERKQAEQIELSAQRVKSDLLARALMRRYNPETPLGLFDTGTQTGLFGTLRPQTLDEAAGLDPRVDRSTFLPYSQKEGLHVPSVVADLMKLATASNPQYSNLMQPEEAMSLATNLMGGGFVASRLAPAPAGSLGMNVTSKRAFTAPHIDTKGLPNKGQELIRSKADELAEILNKQGFQATAEYSGSAVGPSAYVRVFDPQTGRFINDPARISGHSKGAFNSQFVHEISDDPQSMQKFVDLAMEMRAKGPTELMQKQTSAEQTAMQMRYESAQKKLAKGKSLTNSEQEAVNILGRMTSNSAPGMNVIKKGSQEITNNEILENFWKALDNAGDGHIGVRSDDAIVNNSFKKSWNRPDGVKTTRLPGTSVVYVGYDNITKDSLMNAIENSRMYGKNIYLVEGESPNSIQHLANDPGERLMTNNKILSSIINTPSPGADAPVTASDIMKQTVPEPSLMYKDPFGDIE